MTRRGRRRSRAAGNGGGPLDAAKLLHDTVILWPPRATSVRALAHLRAAQRLLRGVYALHVLIHVNKAIRATERQIARDRPAQGSLLELEAAAIEVDGIPV